MPRQKQTHGPGYSRLSPQAYAVAIRMLAEHQPVARVLREVHDRFPQHRPDGEAPITPRILFRLRRAREPEIEELRRRLFDELHDVWISKRRHRLIALQEAFEAAARPTPRRVLRVRHGDGRVEDLLVCEIDTSGMIAAVREAASQIGEDPAGRQATSLEQLVAMAEEARGLPRTTVVEVEPRPALLEAGGPGETDAVEGGDPLALEVPRPWERGD